VDLGLTYTFCQQLHEILRTAAAAKKSVVYYCANHPHKRANSAVLLLAYLVSRFTFFQSKASQVSLDNCSEEHSGFYV
jgi:Dual specificity protein phosphatase, N-terminal half